MYVRHAKHVLWSNWNEPCADIATEDLERISGSSAGAREGEALGGEEEGGKLAKEGDKGGGDDNGKKCVDPEMGSECDGNRNITIQKVSMGLGDETGNCFQQAKRARASPDTTHLKCGIDQKGYGWRYPSSHDLPRICPALHTRCFKSASTAYTTALTPFSSHSCKHLRICASEGLDTLAYTSCASKSKQ